MAIYKLGDILKYSQPSKYIFDGEILSSGKYPILTANKAFILGYTNNKNYFNSEIENSIIFDDFTCLTKYVDFKFLVRSSALKILTLKNIEKFNLKYIYEMINKFNFIANDHKRYWISEFSNLEFNIPDINIQNKYSKILIKIDKNIKNIKNEINLLTEYKQVLLNKIFNSNMFNNGNYFYFKNLFENYNYKNINNYPQYTIGKNKIKKIEKSRHNLNFHKTFKKNDLILGLGIEEIQLNLEIENGCCSPIYNVYKKIDNINIQTEFAKYYIPIIFEKNKNSISKKSQRREFEIVQKELLKLKFKLPKIKNQIKISNILINIDSNLKKINTELKLMEDYKKIFLNKVFN